MDLTKSIWVRNVLVGLGLLILAGNIYNSIVSTGLINWTEIIKDTVLAVGAIVGGFTTLLAQKSNLDGSKLETKEKDNELAE